MEAPPFSVEVLAGLFLMQGHSHLRIPRGKIYITHRLEWLMRASKIIETMWLSTQMCIKTFWGFFFFSTTLMPGPANYIEVRGGPQAQTLWKHSWDDPDQPARERTFRFTQETSETHRRTTFSDRATIRSDVLEFPLWLSSNEPDSWP